MNEFESDLMKSLAESTHPDAKAMKRWFDKHPKGPLRKRALKQMEKATNGNAKAIDWDKIGPFIQLLLLFLKTFVL